MSDLRPSHCYLVAEVVRSADRISEVLSLSWKTARYTFNPSCDTPEPHGVTLARPVMRGRRATPGPGSACYNQLSGTTLPAQVDPRPLPAGPRYPAGNNRSLWSVVAWGAQSVGDHRAVRTCVLCSQLWRTEWLSEWGQWTERGRGWRTEDDGLLRRWAHKGSARFSDWHHPSQRLSVRNTEVVAEDLWGMLLGVEWPT